MLLQTLPAFSVVLLELVGFKRLAGGMDDRAGLEHEGHRIDDMIRLRGIAVRRLLECRRIRSMPAHAIVQAAATRHEAAGLGIVFAMDQTHVFAGDIAVEPRWAEGVFSTQPARRENREID